LPLPEAVVRDVLNLSSREDFQDLWKYLRGLVDNMESEILNPMTDVTTREIMVRVRDAVCREVVELPERALKQFEADTKKKYEKRKTAG
jgi:predicted transcriptional regulator